MPSGERMCERSSIYVLQLAADRHTGRDTTGADAAVSGELADEVGGGLTLHSRIRRENDLFHRAFIQNDLELAHSELLRANAIERRQMSHQHEIPAAIAAGELDRNQVGGRFDDAKNRRITLGCGAGRT